MQRKATLRADAGYADREPYWRSRVSQLCGSGTVPTLAAVAKAAPGSRFVLVPLGSSAPSAGHLAAAIVLHRISCTDSVMNPPCKIVVIPDNGFTRAGYCALTIPAKELEELLNNWRLRSVASGRAPGDFLPAEKGLRRRRRIGRAALPPQVENLHLFFPAYRPATDGSLVPIAPRANIRQPQDGEPAVLFTDAIELEDSPGLTIISQPDYIIVDGRGLGAELDARYFERLVRAFPRSTLAWVLPDLAGTMASKLHGRGARVCWLHTSISSASGEPSLSLTWSLVDEGSDPTDIRRLLELLSEAKAEATRGAGQESWSAYRLLRAAILVLNTLSVPKKYYDDAAVEYLGRFTTSEFLDALKTQGQETSAFNTSLGATIEECHAILSAHSARVNGVRSRKVLEAVEQAVGSDAGLYVVVSNRVTRSAMETFLCDALNTDLADLLYTGIRIETKADIGAAAPALEPRPVLWTAYFGSRDLELLLRLQGRGVTAMVGPLEQQLLREDLQRWLRQAELAEQGTHALGLPVHDTGAAVQQLRQAVDSLRVTASPDRTEPTLPDFESLFSVDIDARKRTPTFGPDTAALRPAVRVRLVDPPINIYVPERALLTVLKHGSGEPQEITVRELQPGDGIVFVDRAVGRTLYELMQEQLSRSPLVGSAAQVVQLWHRAIAEGYRRSGLSYDSLLRLLRERGSRITSNQTTRSWIRGNVLGPRDDVDVDRLAEILQVGKRDGRIIVSVKQSVKGLRSVYRGFARIVYRTVLVAGSGGQLSDAEESLLQDHGLRLSDLREAVSVSVVEDVGATPEMVPANRIGVQVGDQ